MGRQLGCLRPTKAPVGLLPRYSTSQTAHVPCKPQYLLPGPSASLPGCPGCQAGYSFRHGSRLLIHATITCLAALHKHIQLSSKQAARKSASTYSDELLTAISVI